MTKAQQDYFRRLLVSLDFSGLEVNEILRCGSWMELPPEAVFVAQDSTVQHLAFIASGAIDLFARRPERPDRVKVASLGESDMVGWELLTGITRSPFEVVANSHSILFVISHEGLASLRTDSPAAVVKLANAALRAMTAVQKAGHRLCHPPARPAQSSG